MQHKKPVRSVIVLAGALIASSTTVSAYPTGAPLWGPSGLGIMPTTETVPSVGVELGLAYESVRPEFGGSVRYAPVLTATVGLPRTELGAAYIRERFTNGDFKVTSHLRAVHAKYRLLENRHSGMALAVGVHHLDLDEDSGHVSSFYAVATKVLGRGAEGDTLRGHLGVLCQRIRTDIAENETRPMVGLEWSLTKGMTLAADYIPQKDNSSRLWSLVARYEGKSGFGGQIGSSQFRNGDNRFFASLVYRFGGRTGR